MSDNDNHWQPWDVYSDIAEMVAIGLGNMPAPEVTAIHPSADPNATYLEVYGNDHKTHVERMIANRNQSDIYKVVLPESNELQLDYDQTTLPEQFQIGLHFLGQAFLEVGQSLQYVVTRSKSGNLHVKIELPLIFFTLTERVAWQAIFGSDKNREALSLVSLRRGLRNCSLMIEFKSEGDAQAEVKSYTREK